MILYPANGSEPVEFQGQRTLEGMAEFIKEKGSLNVDGVALHDEQEAVRKAEEEKKQEEEAPVDSASSDEKTTAASVEAAAEKPSKKVAKKAEEKAEEADPLAAVYAKVEEAKQFVLKEKDALLAKVQGVINGGNHDEL